MTATKTQEDKELEEAIELGAQQLIEWQNSIRLYIEDKWGLVPQPVRPEYKDQWEEVCKATGKEWERAKKRVTAEWFGYQVEGTGKNNPEVWHWYDPDNEEPIRTRTGFLNKKWYSWQQNLILIGVEKAIAGHAPSKLSVVSGHGVGKSATIAWFVLWFLECFEQSQVPVTAPTSAQMNDVLWKEIAKWIQKLEPDDQAVFEWQSSYVRVVHNPEVWFARARTSTKENTEAIAGVHADDVAIAIDEASGVPEQVYETAQGALTSGNVFLLMISNGTRTIGYFYDSHHRRSEDFQTFQFNCEQSPVVDRQYPSDMAKQYGYNTEEYRIRVKGLFPKTDAMDDSGYLQLIPIDKIGVRVEGEIPIPFIGRKILGVDPAGEGKDTTTFVIRDRFKAKCVKELSTSNDREIAEIVLTLMAEYDIADEDVVVASFGTGADVAKEVALASKGKYNIYTVMEGNTPAKEEEYNERLFRRHIDEVENPEEDPESWKDLYANIRALMNHRMAKWLETGHKVVDESEDSDFAREIASNRYKRSLQGNKIQMMPKKDMRKLRMKSPNKSDALALTLLRDMDEELHREEPEEDTIGDRFSVV